MDRIFIEADDLDSGFLITVSGIAFPLSLAELEPFLKAPISTRDRKFADWLRSNRPKEYEGFGDNNKERLEKTRDLLKRLRLASNPT